MRRVADIAKAARRRFYERRRPANENARAQCRRKADLLQHGAIDTTRQAAPAGWALARERVDDVNSVGLCGKPIQFSAVDDVIERCARNK